MRSNIPAHTYFIGKRVPNRTDLTITNLEATGTNGHLFRGYSNVLKRDLACKIIPRSNLRYGTDRSEVWRAEVQKADVLRNTTVVKFEGIEEWKDLQSGIDCVVLISEFVEGPNLNKFIKDHPKSISVPLVTHFLETALNLFHEMKIRGVRHGDLHGGNVLVEDRSSFDLLGPRYVFRITDFGVGDATSDSQFKDDYLQLADILSKFLGAVDYAACGPREKYIFQKLRSDFLARHLVEGDLTLDQLARQPDKLIARIRECDAEFEKTAAQDAAALLSPFDFLSCEQIGDAPALLHALYSDRFLGLPEVESQNNVVVTGPRGCGKTTVFRSLSLAHKLQVTEAVPDRISYIGIYYRCDDLYFAFPRYKVPARDEAIDIPVHFVTATLLARLLESLEGWARQYFAEEFGRVEAKVSQDIWNVIELAPPQSPGYATFKSLISSLNRERVKAIERNRFVNDAKRQIGTCFGPEVLVKACEVLRSELSYARARPIYFFIDDYSSPKVTKALQANLNRVFMQRVSTCFFKISTESPVSFSKTDIDDKIYVESREFILQNLGLVYLHADPQPKMTFIDDVFRRRLSQTQKPLPAKDLLSLVGSNREQNNNEWARQIRDDHRPAIWGKEALASLCSGDIHYLIGLVGDMVRLSGGTDELVSAGREILISRQNQNRAIREAAGGFLKNLRSIPSYGERLVAIVESFGNVSASHMKYLDSKNEEGSPPKQATRIEPYEPFALSDDAKKLYDELLRYSVFIEDYRGKSRRGNVVPRLFLRRFLIPHFNLTFSTRDSIELEPTEFEEFIMKPRAFEDKFRLKSLEDAKRFLRRQGESEVQLPLRLEPPSA